MVNSNYTIPASSNFHSLTNIKAHNAILPKQKTSIEWQFLAQTLALLAPCTGLLVMSQSQIFNIASNYSWYSIDIRALRFYGFVRSPVPSVLWRCWLGGRKGIRPVKTEWWGVGVVICLERGADLHTAQLMLLSLTVSCSSKIQIGFTFLVPAHLGGPGERAVKWVCVGVCVRSPN